MPPADEMTVLSLDVAIQAVARRLTEGIETLDTVDVQHLGVCCWHLAAARDNLDPTERPAPAVRKPSDQ